MSTGSFCPVGEVLKAEAGPGEECQSAGWGLRWRVAGPPANAPLHRARRRGRWFSVGQDILVVGHRVGIVTRFVGVTLIRNCFFGCTIY